MSTVEKERVLEALIGAMIQKLNGNLHAERVFQVQFVSVYETIMATLPRTRESRKRLVSQRE